MKLEKVEIGGIRGKALTSNIGKVYEEFKVKLVFLTSVQLSAVLIKQHGLDRCCKVFS